jgi:hypothetical protein
MKRFADVIVGAKFKSDNPVNGIFAGADDNNRASLSRIQCPQYVEPVFDSEIEIEQNQIIIAAHDLLCTDARSSLSSRRPLHDAVSVINMPRKPTK